MACYQFRNFMKKAFQIRQFSVQSCKFARGSRFIESRSVASDQQIESKELNDENIISLDRKDLKAFQKIDGNSSINPFNNDEPSQQFFKKSQKSQDDDMKSSRSSGYAYSKFTYPEKQNSEFNDSESSVRFSKKSQTRKDDDMKSNRSSGYAYSKFTKLDKHNSEFNDDESPQPFSKTSQRRQDDDMSRSSGYAYPKFTKLDKQNSEFNSVMLMMRSKKEREKRNEILLEGFRLIQDALMAGVVPKIIFFTRREVLDSLVLPKTSPPELFKILYKDMQLWSTVTTSSGLMGIFETPSLPDLKSLEGRPASSWFPLTVVCDNVRDPGNLGAILRVVAGAGCASVLLTKGCVDLWDSKVLRSAAGAHFRIPVGQGVKWEQLREVIIKEEASIYLADHSSSNNVKVPSKIYHEVDFGSLQRPMVLILGGETHGLSEEARAMAELSPTSCRLNIPLAGGVDSLNTGAALSVIVFEMRRQRLLATLSNEQKSSQGEAV